MTVTPSPARPARRLRSIAAAAAAVAVAFSTAFAAPASATTATPSPSPTDGAALTGSVEVTLAPVGNGIVDDGENLIVSVKVANGTASALSPGRITLALGTRALSGRPALTAWLEEPAASVSTEPVATTTLDAVPSGEDRTRGLTVPFDGEPLDPLAPGVYPLLATVEVAGETFASTSAMIVPDADADADAVDTALIMPLSAGPLTEGLLTAEQLAEMTAPEGRLTAQLDAIDASEAVLAVDPAILAAIRVLGTTAPASALEWLSRLEALPNSRFALQFGDADPAVQLEAGLSRPLGARPLTAYADPDDFGSEVAPTPLPSASATPSPTATPAPDDEARQVPPLDELLAVDGARADVYWPASGFAPADVVSELSGLGEDDSPALTLLASRATTEGAAGRTVPARGESSDAQLVIYDADVSAALSDAASTGDAIARSAALTAASAQLAFAREQTGGRPLAVAIDRAASPTRVGIALAVRAVDRMPGVRVVGLDDLTGADARRVSVGDGVSADPERVAAARALLDDEDELERFATILDDPSLLTGPQRAEMLQLLGTAWTADPSAAEAAVDTHRQATAATLDSVALLPASDITLAGSAADLRFWVRNDLPYPVELVLYASSDSLRLSVQNAIPVSATASSNTRVVVPVEARVGSGEVTLQLQLRSRTAVAVGDAQRVDVNVRAEWEGLGIVVMSVLVGGLIVLGGVRTVLQLRARRRAHAAAAAGVHGDDETGADAPAGGDE